MITVEVTYRYGAAALRERPVDSAAAIERLNSGNHAFAALLAGGDAAPRQHLIPVDAADLGMAGDRAAPPHQPFAAVLGCADARVPVELIFGEGPNELFVVRIAGNGLGSDVLGSLHYAIEHLGSLRAMVVLGHSGCGALTAAVDAHLRPANYLPLATSHALRSILDRQLLVVQTCARLLVRIHGPAVETARGFRAALIESAIASNAAFTAHALGQEIARRGGEGPRVVHGVYLLESREVWTPHGTGLSNPPGDAEAFRLYGEALARSPRIADLLG